MAADKSLLCLAIRTGWRRRAPRGLDVTTALGFRVDVDVTVRVAIGLKSSYGRVFECRAR